MISVRQGRLQILRMQWPHASALVAIGVVTAQAPRVAAQDTLAAARATATASRTTQPVHRDTIAAETIADPIAEATREYRSTGIARSIRQGSFVTFPHGHAQPTLSCAVLRACIVELEPGEIVLSRIAGDTERWEIVPAPAGPDGRTVLVVVKPRDCDITTNLVVATDRRLYDLTLDSPPCQARSTNPETPYVRHVRFYYPDETVAHWATPPEPAPVRVAPDVLSLNFAYQVTKDRQFPWSPSQVFDDGARVYIKLPEEAKHAEAPVLFVLAEDGGKTLVNYSVVGGDTYVTDRLFDRAVLIVGVDGTGRQARIERTHGGGR
jgi:type IV secretion system protein VirB9